TTATFNTAGMRGDEGVYEMRHGIDPRAAFAEAIAGFERATTMKHDYVYFDNLGGAHVELAHWAAATGADPAAELAKAETEYQRGLAVNPKASGILASRAKVELIRAEHALGAEEAVKSVDRGVDFMRQAAAIDQNPVEYRWLLASTQTMGARAQLALGR